MIFGLSAYVWAGIGFVGWLLAIWLIILFFMGAHRGRR